MMPALPFRQALDTCITNNRMMKRRFPRIVCAALCCIPLLAAAQTSEKSVSPQRLYQEGQTLFTQKAYSAAIPPLKDYLKQTEADGRTTVEAGQRLEAEYMLACAAYELRSPRSGELLRAFLKEHPSIRAYFHGHENYNEFYDWQGPDYTISLPTFRVDSPMKGDVSGGNETELSFLLISADTDTGLMTVREVLWNTNASDTTTWGQTRTVSLKDSRK